MPNSGKTTPYSMLLLSFDITILSLFLSTLNDWRAMSLSLLIKTSSLNLDEKIPSWVSEVRRISF